MGFTRSISTGLHEVETVCWWPMLHSQSDKGLSQVILQICIPIAVKYLESLIQHYDKMLKFDQLNSTVQHF